MLDRCGEVLLVEDNMADVELLQEAFLENNLNLNLSVVHNGYDALSFLRKDGLFEKSPRPDIILLDLNMPYKSGIDVLMEIKTDHSLKRIPVVILTSSAAEIDILK